MEGHDAWPTPDARLRLSSQRFMGLVVVGLDLCRPVTAHRSGRLFGRGTENGGLIDAGSDVGDRRRNKLVRR